MVELNGILEMFRANIVDNVNHSFEPKGRRRPFANTFVNERN